MLPDTAICTAPRAAALLQHKLQYLMQYSMAWPDARGVLQISDSSVQSIEVVPGAPRQTWTDLFDECASEASAPSHAASDASPALALAPAVSAQTPSENSKSKLMLNYSLAIMN